ncbi:MAG: hypothetical protein KDD33_04360 [Bdellovibrionales bacterium]|nr:hypothetical protein [Bdellovibrionales bacterium]
MTKVLLLVLTFSSSVAVANYESIAFYADYRSETDYSYKILLTPKTRQVIDASDDFYPNNSKKILTSKQRNFLEKWFDPGKLFFNDRYAACFWGPLSDAVDTAEAWLPQNGRRGNGLVVKSFKCRRGTIEVYDPEGRFVRQISSCAVSCRN